ncbi:MAG: hypothetical protein HYY06_28465 [Deltaproteobacteria bacterium]|nr:hypothetical protein [Deltaproteobacteria bacterium]
MISLCWMVGACPRLAEASTVQRLSESLHRELAELTLTLPRPTIDVALCVTPPASADAAAGADRLAARLEALVATALGRNGFRSVVRLGGAHACADPPEEAARVAEGRGAELLVHVASMVQHGRLHLEGTIVRTDRSLWRDLVGGRGGAMVGQIFASARLDAELRFYLAQPHPPLAPRTQSVLFESPGPVLGMVAGDIDGDDMDELVVLRRRAVDVLTLRQPDRRARLVGTLPLDALEPAVTASRDPVGTIALLSGADGGRRIALRVSDHSVGMVVSWDGERFDGPEPLSDYPIDGAIGILCGTVPRGRNTFEPRVVPCSPSPAPGPEVGAGPFWAVSYANVLGPDGSSTRSVGLVLAEARLIVTAAGVTRDLGPTGSAVWVGDLDDDGVLEVAHSAASPPGDPDRLTVTTLPASGPQDGWASRTIAGGIGAIAAGDLDGDGAIELVFAELTPGGSRIWIVD